MNFDLDIENYTRNELIEMFELPSNFDMNINFTAMNINHIMNYNKVH